MEKKLIQELIERKTEGEYWDYKQQWYSKKADMLHDIICMANNLTNHDAYIIIGISDSGELIGVSSDNRKNQENIITFLRNVDFEGGIRPTVYVHTFNFDDKEVDVLEIKNTNHTPYYLNKEYKNDGIVHAYHIYTRIGDTNTPKTESANIDKVEFLWKKRFGLTLSIKERFLQLLDNLDEWIFETEYEGYNNILPEFQIKISETLIDETQQMPERFFFTDKKYYFQRIELLYHNTVVYRTNLHNYDGGKIALPGYDFVKSIYENLCVPCYIMTNFSGKLLRLWTDNSERDYCLRGNPYISNYEDVLHYNFLIFNNEQEKQSFEKYSLTVDDVNNEDITYWDNRLKEYNKTTANNLIANEYILSMVQAKYVYKKWKKSTSLL